MSSFVIALIISFLYTFVNLWINNFEISEKRCFIFIKNKIIFQYLKYTWTIVKQLSWHAFELVRERNQKNNYVEWHLT